MNSQVNIYDYTKSWAGELRRYGAHYDAIVMKYLYGSNHEMSFLQVHLPLHIFYFEAFGMNNKHFKTTWFT